MMKVLHIGEYVHGGVATYVNSLLHNTNVDNYLVLSSDKSLHTWPLKDSHIFYYRYKRRIIELVKAIIYINKIVKEIQPDIIYCHSTWAGVLGRVPFFFKRKKLQVIYNAHGWAFLRDTSSIKKHIYILIERILAYKTDVIINVSKYEYIAACKAGFNAKKLRLLYSGISTVFCKKSENINPFDSQKINLLFVGRFDTPKGIDILINEMLYVKRDDIHLTVIGDNVVDDNPMIKKEDTKNISFLGWIKHEDLSVYYDACDAVIMPSRWEAFGLVAVEAMKYGKAIIVSNRGGLPELVVDDYNGYVFSMDEKHALSRIINTLDKEKLKLYGINGKKLFNEKYTLTKMLEATNKVYCEKRP